jgi:hypothetical protein
MTVDHGHPPTNTNRQPHIHAHSLHHTLSPSHALTLPHLPCCHTRRPHRTATPSPRPLPPPTSLSLTQALSQLRPDDPRGVRLDATPAYLYNPLVPGRVAAALLGGGGGTERARARARARARVRIVVLLREPTERCLSQWFFINGNQCNAARGLAHVLAEAQQLVDCLGLGLRRGNAGGSKGGDNDADDDDDDDDDDDEARELAQWVAAYEKCIDYDSGLLDQLGFSRVVHKSL